MNWQQRDTVESPETTCWFCGKKPGEPSKAIQVRLSRTEPSETRLIGVPRCRVCARRDEGESLFVLAGAVLGCLCAQLYNGFAETALSARGMSPPEWLGGWTMVAGLTMVGAGLGFGIGYRDILLGRAKGAAQLDKFPPIAELVTSGWKKAPLARKPRNGQGNKIPPH